MEIYNASATLTFEALSCFTKAPLRVVLEPGEKLYRNDQAYVPDLAPPGAMASEAAVVDYFGSA